MSQNSLVVPNTGTLSGLSLVNAVNAALDSLNTLNSGGSAPSTTEADMEWVDTTNGLVKQRDGGNANWIIQGIRALPHGGGVRHAGFGTTVTSTSTLTAAMIGQVINLNASAAITLTLPTAISCTQGSGFFFRNIGVGIVTLALQSTDTSTLATIYPGETVWLSSNGLGSGAGVWVDIFHAQATAGFSFGAAGWVRGSGGVIEQWGTVAVPGNSGGTFNFPLTFPNAAYAAVCSSSDAGTSTTYRGSIAVLNQTGVVVANTNGSTVTYYVRAIGR